MAGNSAAFAALRRITRAVSALSRVPSQTAQAASVDIRQRIAEQFAYGVDAYGHAWEKHSEATIKRWGEHRLLDLTGDMSNVSVTPTPGAGIAITLGASYGAFHQVGTKWMPRRPILPDGPLPPTWKAALDSAALKSFAATMKGTT